MQVPTKQNHASGDRYAGALAGVDGMLTTLLSFENFRDMDWQD